MKKFKVSVLEFLSNTYEREAALRFEEWQKNAVFNNLSRELNDANEKLAKLVDGQRIIERLIEHDNNGTSLWRNDPIEVQERWKKWHLEDHARVSKRIENLLKRIEKIENKITKF